MNEDITEWMRDDEHGDDGGRDFIKERCRYCGRAQGSGERLYEVEGEWTCEECFLEWLEELSLPEIADRMDLETRPAGENDA